VTDAAATRAPAPWGRAERLVAGGVRVEEVRGRLAGARLVVWVPAGARAPSMVQAAAELRDRLDPARLRGTVTFLLDGPRFGGGDGSGSRPRAGHAALAEVAEGADAVLALVEGPGDQAPRLELDVDDPAARERARHLGVPLLVKAPRPSPVAAPLLAYVDGVEHAAPTIDRSVAARAAAALGALGAALGLLAPHPRPGPAPLRVVVRARTIVERGPLGGSAEVTIAVGDVVRAGEVLALLGPPGLARTPLPAPAAGVVLSAERSTGGPLIVLGKLDRALARMERLAAARPVERARLAVGWCEWVALPELGLERVKAKLDTGARTCALHVASLERVGDDDQGRPLVEIAVPVGRRGQVVRARVPIVERSSVRDSGGHVERRPVIETLFVAFGLERRVRVSLTDRGDMLFPMLVGRTALGAELLVDPSRRFRFGPSTRFARPGLSGPGSG
jgi:hypothetical protein